MRHRRIGRIGGAVAAALAMCAAALGTAVTPAHAAGASSANLIVDAGAESAAICSTNGLDGMTMPGWTITSGEPTAVCYGAPDGFPDASTPGSPTRGRQFFAGGATGDASLTQTVDVSAAASAIDAGGTTYDLTGWLGGYAGQLDRVGLAATFRNASGGSLGSAQLAPATSTDRGLATKFLYREATGAVPAGTRSISLVLAFTWTAGNTTDGYADDLSLTLSTPLPAPALTEPASQVPGYDHVFMVMMENENYEDIVGNTSKAPYLNSLANANTVLTQSYAVTHPSDPNYVALAAGGLYGLHDNSPFTTTIDAPHIGTRVEQAGKTWKSYIENQNGNCDMTTHGSYSPDDVPFVFFKDIKADQARCAAHLQPLTTMVSDLRSAATTPNFAWFAADGCDDMEGCGITAGDNWLKNTLPNIFASPAWRTQRSLLVITFDEAATKAYGPSYPNRIPTVLIGSQGSVKTGFQSGGRVDHYGVLATVDKALGLAPLTNNDRYAAPVNDAWNPVGTTPAGPITGVGSDRCADVPGSNTTDGTQLILWGCHGAANQRWTLGADRSVSALGKCLTAATANGSAATISTCTGAATQKWTYDPATMRLSNDASGRCLDANGGATADNTKLIVWDCHTGTNQQWIAPS
ncbi:ricin-type beta-trefoil lectin domain protein [Yinghuangia seranimata]|uniref:ricin-type beta-trefoil lectin domain protein n=1 Tax=Yinghuangia seranimata TaxID=408067 RepID=UPI00248BCB2E|nr:ricin-type beta-trefoil lectin domain protein [Yinghuangia seranimata]MDI2125567.1 ricin-type beta-trefoil lectin domain protein [Yinghuangia seranimata]